VWDGCVHIHKGESDNHEYTHICFFEEYVDMLQDALTKAKEHFKNKKYDEWSVAK
jgi:hypothetical protein